MLALGDAGSAQDLGAKATNEGLLKDVTKGLLSSSNEQVVDDLVASRELVEVVEAGDQVTDEVAFPADKVGEYLAPPPVPPTPPDDDASEGEQGDDEAEGEDDEELAK